MIVLLQFLFLAFLLVIMGLIMALPFPYPLIVCGLIVLGCLYWIYRIVSNPNLSRKEKWDRLWGRTF